MAAGGVRGAGELAADLLVGAQLVRAGTVAVTEAFGAQNLALTKAKAPRSPGGGGYANSWTSDLKLLPDGVAVHNFTDAPEAARLEYGFHGRDSRGRVYDQAPRSHQRAANDAIYRPVYEALRLLAERAVRG